MTWADRVARARAEGVCVRCGDPHEGEAQVCRACQADKSMSDADRREERRAAGLCRCGHPVAPGRVQCLACNPPSAARSGWPRGRPRKVREAEQAATNRGAVGADSPNHAGPTVPGGR